MGILVSYAAVATGTSTNVVDDYNKNTCKPGLHRVKNPSPHPDEQSPDIWYYKIPTTIRRKGYNDNVDREDNDDTGVIVLKIHRDWAPNGADRFYSLVKDNYYDCAIFFRVVIPNIIQWGIASTSKETKKWNTPIQDDPRLEKNTPGMVSFAMSGPNSRTTQVFVNGANNSGLDRQGFVPFAEVVHGYELLFDNVYAGVGTPTNTEQIIFQQQGNPYFLHLYPEADIIKGLPLSEYNIIDGKIPAAAAAATGGAALSIDTDFMEQKHQQNGSYYFVVVAIVGAVIIAMTIGLVVAGGAWHNNDNRYGYDTVE